MRNNIAVIPIASGSTSYQLPFKGKPVLAWSIAAAVQCDSVNAVFALSDDNAALELAERLGTIPIALDTAIQMDNAAAIKRAVGTDFDTALVLNPEFPLRSPKDIQQALAIMEEGGFASLTSAYRPSGNIWSADGQPSAEPALADGTALVETGSIKGIKNGDATSRQPGFLLMPQWKAAQCDTPDGFSLCEHYANSNGLRSILFPLRQNDLGMIAYDFDGVLTDNRAMVSQDGAESVTVNRSDGLVILRMAAMGIKQVIISKERNPVVLKRAEKLNLEVTHACDDKVTAFEEYRESHGVPLEKTFFFGNDLNDIEVMKIAGTAVAPSDATPAAKALADIITSAKGGYGVVREFFDMVDWD